MIIPQFYAFRYFLAAKNDDIVPQKIVKSTCPIPKYSALCCNAVNKLKSRNKTCNLEFKKTAKMINIILKITTENNA